MITNGVYRKNSADLGLGRRPELKSEEFSYRPQWLPRNRGVKTHSQQNKCYTFWELYPLVVPTWRHSIRESCLLISVSSYVGVTVMVQRFIYLYT